MPTPPLPTFIVLGAARAGTTSIHRYLEQHTDVCVSQQKETDFFAYRGEAVHHTGPGDDRSINETAITSLEAYQEEFDHWDGEEAIGEASPNYLYVPGTAENIVEFIPETKLIISLRQPADRAYSDFINMVKLGFETTHSFKEALDKEDERIEAGWGPYYHYKAKGFYAEQISRYTDRFPREQLHVLCFEDLMNDPVAAMQEIYRFIEVDPSIKPDTQANHNASGIPTSRGLHDLVTRNTTLRWVRKTLVPDPMERWLIQAYNERFLNKPPFSPDLRSQLTAEYREDTAKLEALLDLDLSRWTEPRDSHETTSIPM